MSEMNASPVQRPPHFFIVGAPKCGTTSMAQYLNAHPDIFVIRGEPHFFGSDIDYNKPRLSAKQYASLCRASAGKPVCGERSTWYLYSQRAAREIHDFNPNARIIAIIRNPADMLHSLHSHHFHRGQRDDIEDFEAALAAEPERRRGRNIPKAARFPASLFYSELPRYAEQLQRYIDQFGIDRVKVILFDDLKNDPAAVYRETLSFLGLSDDFEPDFRIHNAAAPTSRSWIYRAWKASTLRYRVRSLAPQPLYDALRERRRKRLQRSAIKQPRAVLNDRLRQTINARFANEIDRLEELLDRDLNHWRANPDDDDRSDHNHT
ncbi:MAG: sulfotransferase [Wenzhouxiangellaceae bacterium]|nr:sulfotransferase [Wenzhouxiangellaceae bacterium]